VGGAVKIAFDVGGRPAQFRRDPFFGSAYVVIDGQKTTVASLWKLDTYFSSQKVKIWKVSHRGHEVEIEKARPPLLGGLLPNLYTVRVDGIDVASSQGF
jgi:hypothetical protein